jgi:hypothetical protein
MDSTTSICPSWAKRQPQPADISELLTWLEKVAQPRLMRLAPDRCFVDENGSNTGKPVTLGFSKKAISDEASCLWDDVTRACDLLAHWGLADAPDRMPQTTDPHEAIRFFENVRKYLRNKLQLGGPWSKPDTPSRWAKRFGVSVDTMKRQFKTNKIRNKRLSDRSYQIHEDDVPKVLTEPA